MLRVLQNKNVFNNTTATAKCGEIYCHSPTDFTILCVFCELKSFEYEDFLLHIRNMHFENSLLKTEEINVECARFFNSNVKDEFIDEQSSDESFLEDHIIQTETEEEESRCINWNLNDLSKGGSDDSDDMKHEDIGKKDHKLTSKREKRKEKLHKCEYCPKICLKPGRLQLHIENEHPLHYVPPTPVKCTECSNEFLSERILNQHYTKEHNGIPCSFCGKRFSCKSKLNEHIDVHVPLDSETKFVCDFENCSKSFTTRRRMADHKRRHVRPKNFVCDICGFSCQSKGTLHIHNRTHSDVRPYPCDVCNIRFKEKRLLIRHYEIHTHQNQRNFLCSFENCTKAFFTSRQLTDHKRKHTRKDKYICNVCSYSTSEKQALEVHCRKHTIVNS